MMNPPNDHSNTKNNNKNKNNKNHNVHHLDSNEFVTTITDTNLTMIHYNCMNYIQEQLQLPNPTMMYHSMIQNTSGSSTTPHSTTGSTTARRRFLVSESLLLIWDIIMLSPPPPPPPPPIVAAAASSAAAPSTIQISTTPSLSSSTTTTTSATTTTTNLISSVLQQYNQNNNNKEETNTTMTTTTAAATTTTTTPTPLSSSDTTNNDILSFIQSIVPYHHVGSDNNTDTTNTTTTTTTTTTDETISSYQNRILQEYILHRILLPVIQQINSSNTNNNSNNNNNSKARQQQQQVRYYMNTIASSINFKLISMSIVPTTSTAANHNNNNTLDHKNKKNTTGLVQLLRHFIQYINDHPSFIVVPVVSTTTTTTTTSATSTNNGTTQMKINPLSESLLKYCTNLAFLHDIGILQVSVGGSTNGTSTSTSSNRQQQQQVQQVEQLVSKRLRMVNTAIHYRQYKFNLLVEESEGYAKLLLYLQEPQPQQPHPNHSTTTTTTTRAIVYQQLYDTLHAIIGTFHLDPNRCLDIIIDLIEYEFFIITVPLIHENHPTNQQQQQRRKSSLLLYDPEQQHNSLLQMYIDCISMLQSTTKLPQLLGYKLRCRMETAYVTNHSPTTIGVSSFHTHNDNPNTGSNHPSTTTVIINNDDGTTTSSVVPYNVSSLLNCMAWLCLQEQYNPNASISGTIPVQALLEPVKMLSYIPDDADINDTKGGATKTIIKNHSYEEMLEFVYGQFVSDEKIRIRSVGRVSLTNTPTAATGKTDISSPNMAYSVATIEDHCITQWISIFIQNQQFTMAIQDLLSHVHYTMLSVILPQTIGVAILDYVQTRYVTKWLSIIDSTSWSSSSPVLKDDDDKNKKNDIPTVEDILMKIVDPLMFTMESGCIIMRPILYCQLCRLLTHLLNRPQDSESTSNNNNNNNASDDVVMSDSNNENSSTATEPLTKTTGENNLPSTKLLNFLQDYLVPCLSVFHSNPAMSMELWNVIKALPYSIRYSLYGAWRGTGIEQRSLLTSSAELGTKPLWLIEGELRTGKDIRYALKRISKDTIRDMSRAVAKCCHCHPLVVFTTILNQIESYDNLVQVMVDACRFVTPLSLDVLGFCILQRLSDSNDDSSESRSRLKANGVNVSQWLQSLEAFTGAFYKRFPHVEFQGLLFYLLQRLKDGHVMELGVLRTLLKNGAGWSFADYSPAESLSMTQLEGRAGSTRLKRETMTFGVVSEINLSSSNEVRRVLHNNNIGVSLLILLTQVRHSIIFQKSQRSIPVKLIGNLVDTSQLVMSILLDFLTNEVDRDGAEIGPKSTAIQEYASSLPTLVELQDRYKIEVASSWTLCRPLIRAGQIDPNIDSKLTKHLSSSIPHSALTGMVSKSVWKHITTELFQFFYSTSSYDIFCPRDVYENEIVRLERETERLSQKKNAPPPTSIQPGAIPEKSDREEYERVKQMVIGLKDDYAEQTKHVASMHETMLRKIADFFVSNTVTVSSAMTFFTRCVYPRCMQGPDDAMYCTHFVALLHQNATPGFSTLHYFDALIQIVPRSLYCLTEGEAACASILLLDTWKTVSKWRYDDSSFESELVGKPGAFIIKNAQGDPVMATKQDYENLYNKWHAAIGDTLVGCLRSKEYIHLRCGLIVLTRIVDEFPTRPKLANALLEALDPLKEESNTFADIRASSQAYSMQLLRSRDNGVWKEEDAATVQARLAVVEAATMERQKKALEQMEQIERDSVKITATIGTSETRVRGRGSTLLRSNSDERLNRSSNIGVSDANRRRTATSSGTTDDAFRGGGPTANTSSGGGGGATSSFSSYASIAPIGGESSATGPSIGGGAGRTLHGRWVHASSGTTPPRNPGSSAISSTTSTTAATGSTGGTTTKGGKSDGTAATTNTRKRGRISSSPTSEQPDEPSSSKRTKVSQSDGDNKRSRGRHAGTRRT